MNRFEAAQIFGLLSDADQLKIVKMAYNHGIVTLNGIVEEIREEALLVGSSAGYFLVLSD